MTRFDDPAARSLVRVAEQGANLEGSIRGTLTQEIARVDIDLPEPEFSKPRRVQGVCHILNHLGGHVAVEIIPLQGHQST